MGSDLIIAYLFIFHISWRELTLKTLKALNTLE